MGNHIKYLFVIIMLCCNQFVVAQSLLLREIVAEADRLIEESKDKQALKFLELIDINDYKNESDLELGSFCFVKAVAYGLNDSIHNCIQSFIMACDFYEKSGCTYENENYLLSLQSLGQIYYNHGKLELSEMCYRKIIINVTAPIILNNNYQGANYLCNAYSNLGIIYVDRKEIDKANMCLSYLKQMDKTENYYYQLYGYINK